MLHESRESAEQRRERMTNRTELRQELRDVEAMRPKTRADCHRVRLALVSDLPESDPMRLHRPCPFISCRHHLHADVQVTRTQETRQATITILGGDIAHTCALDVIDEHPDGLSREEIASVLRVSEERTRIAERALERKLRGMNALDGWQGHECAWTDPSPMEA